MVRSVYGAIDPKKLVAKKTTNKAVDKTVRTPKPVVEKTVKPKPVQEQPKPTVVVPTTRRKADARPRVAMFIDVDNANVSRENLLEILFYMGGKYKIEICKLYGYNEESLPGIKEVAGEYNLVTIGKTQYSPIGQRGLDARVLVDAYECAVKNAQCVDTIFVWCFPCDLTDLFAKITDLGIATATIEHPAFDCKNKFVSQTIKLYSKYDFTLEEPMFSKVKTPRVEPLPIIEEAPAPAPIPMPEPTPIPEPLPELQPEPEPTPTPTPIPEPIPEPAPAPVIQDEPQINPVVVPEPMPESMPEPAPQPEPQKTSSALDLETLDGLPIPVLPKREIPERSVRPKPAVEPTPTPEPDTQPPVQETAADFNDVSIFDIMKKVGLMDDEKKPVKYEDTIGDLWYNVSLWKKYHIMNCVKCGLISTKVMTTR